MDKGREREREREKKKGIWKEKETMMLFLCKSCVFLFLSFDLII